MKNIKRDNDKKGIIDVATEVKIHNRFDVVKRNAITGEEMQVARAYNLITDQWWTRISSGATFEYIAYGNGTGTPSATDTDLFNRVGIQSGANLTYDVSKWWSDGYLTVRKEVTIPAGTLTGTEFTEVGISYGSEVGKLVTHAMIEDMNGNTISVVKGADDDLIFYATVFLYVDVNGYNGGIKWGYPLWVINEDPFIGRLDHLSAWLTGVYYNLFESSKKIVGYQGTCPVGGFVNESYLESYVGEKDCSLNWDYSSKKLTFTNNSSNAHRIGSSDLNPSSGNCLMGISYYCSSGIPFSLRIDMPVNGLGGQGTAEDNLGYVPISHLKNAGVVGTGDGITTDFQTPFPFIKDDSSFKIYLDGVELSDTEYTVDYNKPATNNIGLYFNRLEGTKTMLATVDYKRFAGDYEIVENPFYGTYNITKFNKENSYLNIYTSDDLVTWTEISGNGTVSVPEAQQSARYWKAVCNTLSVVYLNNFIDENLTDLNNIHFNTAPADGVAITHDARYLCIPKSEDTYFDIVTTISLSEKTS